MINFFSIDTVFFTVMQYPMSYLEFFGTILNIWCVWLVARNKILNWPVGIVAVILFMLLFFQIQLYSDFLEQIYFLVTGFYGWWVWSKRGKKDGKKVNINTKIKWSNLKARIWVGATVVLGTLALGAFISNIHVYFPSIFVLPASFPFLDAFTTVMSFVATILLVYHRIEAWMLWIVVDIIGIWLYFVKDVKFISLLYCIFLVLATKGLITWYLLWKKHKQLKTNTAQRPGLS